MKNITETAQLIKYSRQSIENSLELLQLKIESDEEYKSFSQKLYEETKISNCFHSSYFEFSFFKVENDVVISLFRIDEFGNVLFTEKNIFDGIEEVAAEAHSIVAKFY